MAKNIILCSDGTGNSDIKGRGTNVFKLFEAVNLNGHRTNPALDAQVAFYDDGVGSRGNTLFKAMGGAAGFGLKRNVKDLYRALSRVYDEGDRIYLFGFSRGAFTARTLAGLIGTCGIVQGETCQTTHALRTAVEVAYRAYRTRYNSLLTSAVRGAIRRPDSNEAIERFHSTYRVHKNVPIAFIGVWDTVDAVGMPFALSSLFNRFIYQFKFPTQTLGKSVKHACHALSIDDARVAFEPVLWMGPDERIEQVWFAGAHSNVGGGYPKQGMSLVALDWMLAHAERAGLRVHAADRELFRAHASVDDMLYDPRSGLGLFYRWAPRDIRKYCNRNGITPRIHLTVAERIALGTADYAPGNIPPTSTVAITPVHHEDPNRLVKERVLTRRAEAVQQMVQRALNGRYLLNETKIRVGIGEWSYWSYMFACAALLFGVGYLGGFLVGLADMSKAGPLLGAAVVLFGIAQLLGRYADHTMTAAFSQFWQQHQKDLRQSLKSAHHTARQESSRLDLSELRKKLST